MSEPTDLPRPGAYDATRPLVLGYLRASLCGSAQELAAAREQLAFVAQAEGYTLGAVFTEEAETAPAAFSALVDAVKHYEAKGIVVPSPEHLAVLGAQPPLSGYLQRVTGVPLIVVRVLTATTSTRRRPIPRRILTPGRRRGCSSHPRAGETRAHGEPLSSLLVGNAAVLVSPLAEPPSTRGGDEVPGTGTDPARAHGTRRVTPLLVTLLGTRVVPVPTPRELLPGRRESQWTVDRGQARASLPQPRWNSAVGTDPYTSPYRRGSSKAGGAGA